MPAAAVTTWPYFPGKPGRRARRRQRVELREGIGLIDGDGSEQQRVDSSSLLARARARVNIASPNIASAIKIR